jgi:cyd operon protein YbgT
MWYFSWILGLGLALTFGVLNAVWYDVVEQKKEREARRAVSDTPPSARYS